MYEYEALWFSVVLFVVFMLLLRNLLDCLDTVFLQVISVLYLSSNLQATLFTETVKVTYCPQNTDTDKTIYVVSTVTEQFIAV